MRFVTIVIAGCIALAILKVAVQVALVIALTLLLWLGITRPRQTFAFLLMFVAVGLIGNYPTAGLIVFGLLAGVGILKPGD